MVVVVDVFIKPNSHLHLHLHFVNLSQTAAAAAAEVAFALSLFFACELGLLLLFSWFSARGPSHVQTGAHAPLSWLGRGFLFL
jgi:hypothetical protein